MKVEIQEKQLLQYINIKKIDEAKRLLVATAMPLTEISEYLSYSSQSYFHTILLKTERKYMNFYITCSCYCFHIVTHFQKLNFFYFLKVTSMHRTHNPQTDCSWTYPESYLADFTL